LTTDKSKLERTEGRSGRGAHRRKEGDEGESEYRLNGGNLQEKENEEGRAITRREKAGSMLNTRWNFCTVGEEMQRDTQSP